MNEETFGWLEAMRHFADGKEIEFRTPIQCMYGKEDFWKPIRIDKVGVDERVHFHKEDTYRIKPVAPPKTVKVAQALVRSKVDSNWLVTERLYRYKLEVEKYWDAHEDNVIFPYGEFVEVPL